MNQSRIDELMKIDLFEALNIDGLSAEKKLEAMDEIAQVAMKGIWLKILENLSEEEQEQLNLLLDKEPSPEELTTFLKTSIPDLENLIKGEIASYKAMLLPPEINF
ncbi:MAG: hypothetical protein WCW78_00270 [Candidatus Paceibacterota bacterium]|jgi:hypothetical protein